MPLAAGATAQEVRTGGGLTGATQAAAGQFAGANYIPEDRAYDLRVRWQKEFKAYLDLPGNSTKAKNMGVQTRDAYRKAHPEIEAKLFIAGEVTSLSKNAYGREAARDAALALMKQYGLKMDDVKGLRPEDDENSTDLARRKWFAEKLGETLKTGKTSSPKK